MVTTYLIIKDEGVLLASPVWVLMHPLKKNQIALPNNFYSCVPLYNTKIFFQQISDKPESKFSLLFLVDKWYWPNHVISLSLSFSICKTGTECFSYRLAEEK